MIETWVKFKDAFSKETSFKLPINLFFYHSVHRSILVQSIRNQRRTLISSIASPQHSIIPLLLRLSASIIPFLVALVVSQILPPWHPDCSQILPFVV